MANLYFEEGLAGMLREDALVEVAGEEAHHAVRVSRLRIGERIAVGDGAGAVGEGVVEQVAKDRFSVRIDALRTVPPPEQRLVLVQALAKGDRDERAVEQATEFGVDAILPWQAERSVSRWSGAEKIERGVQKWRRIAREASKQSLRARIPEVRDPATLAELCEVAARHDAELLVLHPRATAALSAWARSALTGQMPQDGERGEAAKHARPSEILLVIGPEGGLSDEELDVLDAAGARILSLGDTVLRTSSAGPAALAVLNVALARW